MYFLLIRKGFLSSESYYGQSMGIAYAVVISVYIVILMFTFPDVYKFGRKDKVLNIIGGGISLFIILIDCRSRGPIITIIISVVIFFLAKQKRHLKIFWSTLISIVGIIVYLNFKSLIMWGANFLARIGIKIAAIDKFVFLYNSKIGVGNGRDYYYEKAFEAIKSSPILGHGVGYFELLANGEYVHNFFLEILVCFGIVGLMLGIMLIFYKPFVYIFKKENSILTGYILFLLCIGELMLNFSSSFWLSPPFWYMFFFFLQDESFVARDGDYQAFCDCSNNIK